MNVNKLMNNLNTEKLIRTNINNKFVTNINNKFVK